MRKVFFSLIIFGLVAWPSTPLLADEDPVHPEGIPLPREAKIRGEGDKNLIPVWVAYQGLVPLKKIGAQMETMKDRKPFTFLEMCYWSDRYQIGENWYYLLVNVDGKENTVKQNLGWVDWRYLLINPEAKKRDDTTLYEKGLIVNSVEFLQLTSGKKEDLSKLVLLTAPRADAPGRDEPHRLYNILFIYGEAEGYYLLGSNPVFNPQLGERDAREVVLGWMTKERICHWESREAFEWNSDSTAVKANPRRSVSGKIFEKEEQALSSFSDPTVPFLFEEEFNERGVSQPMPYDQPRFPVLKRRVNNHFKGGELIKVGGIGGFTGADGKVLRTTKELQELRRLLARIQAEATRTEILFVIDDTSSMDKWFKDVADTFEEIMAPLRKGLNRDVLLAVSYYNDVTKFNSDPVIANEMKGAKVFGDKIANELRNHKVHEGGDALEMVFRGICEAIDKAGFSAEARKIVIVLGDCGDISASERRLEADPRYKTLYNEQTILDRLIPKNQSPIEFFAIQVVNPANDADYAAFRTQMRSIQRLYTERLKGSKLKASAGYFVSSDHETVRDTIIKRYAYLDAEASDLKRMIDRFGRGQWRTTKISEEFKQILERKNVKLDDLMKIDGFQVFHYGYVWAKGPEQLPQITERLFLNDFELETLTNMLKGLEERNLKLQPSLQLLLNQVIEQQAGNVYRGKDDKPPTAELTLDQILKKVTGLKFRSSLLVNRLPEKGVSPLTDNEYFEVLKRYSMLEDIRKDQRYYYRAEVENRAGREITRWVRTMPENPKDLQEKRGFTLPGEPSLLWYWIDYQKEWP